MHLLHFIQFRKSDQFFKKYSHGFSQQDLSKSSQRDRFFRQLINPWEYFTPIANWEKAYRKDSNKRPGAYSLFFPLKGRLFEGGAYSNLYGIYILQTLFKHYLWKGCKNKVKNDIFNIFSNQKDKICFSKTRSSVRCGHLHCWLLI